jgi:hypothetical protein
MSPNRTSGPRRILVRRFSFKPVAAVEAAIQQAQSICSRHCHNRIRRREAEQLYWAAAH